MDCCSSSHNQHSENKKSTKSFFIILIGILVIGVIFLIFFIPKGSSFEAIDNFEGTIGIYKSSSCGCCGVYTNYFQTKGNKNARAVNLADMEFFKNQHKIPNELESCHTTLVGDYFVEGHVPLEAIEKLLEEMPDIEGIAMPGMPNGSPGMPGTKNQEFVIYSVNHDGSYQEFMRI